jgi:putative tryptophan/tyrosine transport system substrate-binding protein
MRRREFITGFGGAAAWPLMARAQGQSVQFGPERMARVGVVGPDVANPVSRPGIKIFLAELGKLGFTEGANLIVEFRRSDSMQEAFTGANELVAAKTDVLVAFGPEIALQAAVAARPAVPIVMLANNFDPFARGYVKTLAQPGGNVTGFYYRQPELAAKQLELLVEAFPERKRVAVLWDVHTVDQFAAAERAAGSMGLSSRALKLENPPYNLEAAFHNISQHSAQMLHVLSSPLFTPHRHRIAELAIQHRLPSMFIFSTYVTAGGLMSYGVDTGPAWRRAASSVAKILRGAKPADLPVEQVTSFEFAVNLKTAKAIDITLPTSILLRADEVIE